MLHYDIHSFTAEEKGAKNQLRSCTRSSRAMSLEEKEQRASARAAKKPRYEESFIGKTGRHAL